jgi:branched-chain amino acid transport system substrate-binding protein
VVASDAKLGGTLGKYAVGNPEGQEHRRHRRPHGLRPGRGDEFVKGAKKALPGVQIVAKEFTNDKATDFNAILTSIKAKKPDLVFFGGMDSVGGPMLKQMKALGIKAKFMGGDGICTEAHAEAGRRRLGQRRGDLRRSGRREGPQEKVHGRLRRARYKKKFKLRRAAVRAVCVRRGDGDGHRDAERQIGRAGQVPAVPEEDQVPGRDRPDPVRPKGDIKDGALTLFTYKGGKKTKMEVIK